MGSDDVDTDKFGSWPLLRPDELASLPSGVLKASLEALDLLCAQNSDEDAIGNYAQRQRERTTSLLSKRAAQVRVRALLTGSTSPSLSTTASHGILSTDGKSRHNRRSSSEPQPDLPSGRKPDFGYDSEGGCFPSVRSPPKARVEHQHQRQPHYQIAPLAGFPTATSPLTLDSARGRHNGNQLDESSPGEGDRKCDVDNNTPQACARESSNDRLCEADWPGGRGIATVSDAANPGKTCARRQDMHTSRQERGQPSLPNVMHEKWGSVFVVGGGQRRRRTSVRRRSVETEDTPATRRAHVDKERQERRKASLCRLLARKEQRALQQETRRKRRAAAARATAATATAAAAAAETAETATTSTAEEAGMASAATTTTTTKTTPTPSAASSSATDTAPLLEDHRSRSPAHTANEGEINHIASDLSSTPATAPASAPAPAWRSDANAVALSLGTRGGNAGKGVGHEEGTFHDNVDGLSRDGDQQPRGRNRPAKFARAVSEICEGHVPASSSKGNIPDTMALRDSISSSESESVSGGDSSDDGGLSAGEGGEQNDSRAAQLGHKQRLERATRAENVHFGANGAGEDAAGIAADQPAALLEGHGDIRPSTQVELAFDEDVTVSEPTPCTANGVRDYLVPGISSGPVGCYDHEKLSAKELQAAAIHVDVGPRSVADKVGDDDAPQKMAITAVGSPVPDNTITSADDREELRGSGTDSDMQSYDDSGSASGHGDATALELPGPLDVGPPKTGRADGRVSRGQSKFVSPKTSPMPMDDRPEPAEDHRRPGTDNAAPASSVMLTLDEEVSRRPSDVLSDNTSSAGQPNTETGSETAPRPTEAPAGGAGIGLESVAVHRPPGGAVATQVRHRHKSLPCMPTGSDSTARNDFQRTTRCSLGEYTECFPRIGAILSSYHNGRALTRETDCRSLPLTSSIMARGRGGRGVSTGLTASEEEACLHLQLKLYSIYVRVIKDYAAVFSLGDGWPTSGEDDPSSLVYSGDPSALHYRVNSKSRPEVYNIVTDVLNNRCEQWEELPTGLGLKTTWNLLWTWSKPHIQYSSLLVWQKVNHFPNSRELTRKDLLNKHISRFMAPGGRLAKEFHIMPQTFVLPHEFTTFIAAFTSSGHCGRDRGKSRADKDTPACVAVDSFDKFEGRDGRGGRGGESMAGVGRRDNVWIMKPVGMSRGRGIRLIDDIKNITYADKVVLQRYIGTPLLLDGYKFDLRLYVLVTSFNPLEAFMYKEGFARVSTHLYEKGDIGNPFIHLTNSSVQRLNESGATRDNPLHHANLSEAGGTKTTLSYLWRRLAASGVDVGALWTGICSVVVKSLVCVEGSIPNQPNSFELFGYDVLIDDKLRPWLIEVNASPSMARDNHIDRQVKEALIFDTIHLVDPLPFDRQNLADVLEKRLSATDKSKAWSFKERPVSENFDHRNASAPSFEEDNNTETGVRPSVHGSRPRRRRDEVELDNDLYGVLRGRMPRNVGELPNRMGNFVRLCPATAAYRHARRLRRRVIRPPPGDDNFDTD